MDRSQTSNREPMSNKQTTAVEWLASEINSRGPIENNPPKWLQELYDKAKQIERKQIEDAWCTGNESEPKEVTIDFAEQYFTSTFTDGE